MLIAFSEMGKSTRGRLELLTGIYAQKPHLNVHARGLAYIFYGISSDDGVIWKSKELIASQSMFPFPVIIL